MIAAGGFGAFDAAMQALRPFGGFVGNGSVLGGLVGLAYRRPERSERVKMGIVAGKIEARLRGALSPTALAITDDSDSHRGHAGHDGSGESHFTVEITAAAFAGQSRVARQRLVYAALGDLMAPGGVHALVIKAKAVEE